MKRWSRAIAGAAIGGGAGLRAWVAGVGTAASLFAAWFVGNGPAADRGAWPYVLVLGPIVSLVLAALPLLVRLWLRRMIRPNRGYPAPPTLPPGTPSALREDPASGELVGQSPKQAGPDDRIEFKVGRDGLPDACCVCLGPPSPKESYPRLVHTGLELRIPLCVPCARARRGRLWRIGLAIAGLAVAASYAILALSTSDEAVFWILFGGLTCVAPGLGSMIASRIVDPFRIGFMQTDRGVISMWFRNAAYPRLIADARAASSARDASPFDDPGGS